MTSCAYLTTCGLDLDTFIRLRIVFRDALALQHGEARRLQAGRLSGPPLLQWGRKYLLDYFTRPASAMHGWLGEKLDAMGLQRGLKLNVLGPRGGAKSTIGTLTFPLRVALERRDPYIWIVSDTKHQACAHLENVKSELIDNPGLAAAYPSAAGRGPVWRAEAIVLRNGVAVEAFGTGQSIRGRRHRAHRPTLIICDDLENDRHMQSALQREHSRDWFFGTLLKAGTNRTNVVNLATALHREALAMRLVENPGWISRVFRAIERWPENMSLWEQWEAVYTGVDNPRYREAARAFYHAHRVAMDLGSKVLWPEEEDLYTLMCLRAEGGRAAFEREKQNSPINPDLCEWPESYFDDSVWFGTWPVDFAVKTLALDPSKGSDARRGDYSAFVMLGVTRRGILYLEADMARRPTPQIVAEGVQWYRRFQPDAFGVEANQFQELLAAEFEREFRKQGLLAARPWPLHNRVNKQVRIRRLGPYLASGRLRFKRDSPSTRLLVDQLRDFPVGDHDDGPDAAEMALRLAIQLMQTPDADDGLGDRLPVG
ncbi:MAG: phage terminase large subunit family protein [Planctomycetota bacterium]|jgi:predicted phage terminase large subunit-like protein